MKKNFNFTSGMGKNLSQPFKVVASAAMRALRTIFSAEPQDKDTEAHQQAKSLMTGCFDPTPDFDPYGEESDTSDRKRSPKPFHASNKVLRPQ